MSEEGGYVDTDRVRAWPRLPRNELADLITQMNEQMLAAARELQFEVAARLRDELNELKRELRQLDAAHA